MAPNAELKRDGGSERQIENAMMMALNAKIEKWWWWLMSAETKNAIMMTLNAETKNATLNVELKM